MRLSKTNPQSQPVSLISHAALCTWEADSGTAPGNKRPLVKGTPSKPGVVPSKPGVRPSISRPLQPKLSSSTGPPKATIGPVARKTAVGTTSVSKDPPSKPEASKPERPTHARTPSTVSSAPSTVRGRTTNAPVANGKTAPSKPATERKPITGPRPSVAAKAPLRSSVSGVKAPLKDNAGLDSLKEKVRGWLFSVCI
jgi:hypothetical protein